jgi:hypothetical protein
VRGESINTFTENANYFLPRLDSSKTSIRVNNLSFLASFNIADLSELYRSIKAFVSSEFGSQVSGSS